MFYNKCVLIKVAATTPANFDMPKIHFIPHILYSRLLSWTLLVAKIIYNDTKYHDSCHFAEKILVCKNAYKMLVNGQWKRKAVTYLFHKYFRALASKLS